MLFLPPSMLDVFSVSATQGFDSVVARGVQEPDLSKDTVMTLDGKQVTVPQGKPLALPCYSNSHFSNSEYLVRVKRKYTPSRWAPAGLLRVLFVFRPGGVHPLLSSCHPVFVLMPISPIASTLLGSRDRSVSAQSCCSSASCAPASCHGVRQIYKESQQRIRYMMTIRC